MKISALVESKKNEGVSISMVNRHRLSFRQGQGLTSILFHHFKVIEELLTARRG